MELIIDDYQLQAETHNLYDVQLNNTTTILTTVTHDPDIVSVWLATVESIHRHRIRLIVGLDVEWRPHNRSHRNPAATLQLCVGHRCLIFQLTHASSIPSSLVEFLGNRNYTFVGIGIDSGLEMLLNDYGFGHGVNAVDLRDLAAEVHGKEELRRRGLEALARIVLGMEIEKPRWITRSRWDHRWLSAHQVAYACLDAYVCFEIGRELDVSSVVNLALLGL